MDWQHKHGRPTSLLKGQKVTRPSATGELPGCKAFQPATSSQSQPERQCEPSMHTLALLATALHETTIEGLKAI